MNHHSFKMIHWRLHGCQSAACCCQSLIVLQDTNVEFKKNKRTQKHRFLCSCCLCSNFPQLDVLLVKSSGSVGGLPSYLVALQD